VDFVFDESAFALNRKTEKTKPIGLIPDHQQNQFNALTI
jgi:hypothetical protein